MNKNKYKNYIMLLTKCIKLNRVDYCFTKLKYDYSPQEIEYILDNLKLVNSSYYKSVFGNNLPKKYSELMVPRLIKIRPNNIDKEVNWQSILLDKNYKQINEFLNYKNIYEENMVLGNYIKAKEILDKIEEKICVSMWSIENRLIIEELSNGIAGNKNEFSRITNFSNNKILKLLIQLISLRVEDGMSIIKYKSFLSKIIEDKTEISTLFTYYLDYPNLLDEHHDLQSILYMQNNNSIIDIYLSFINIIELLILKCDNYKLNIENLEVIINSLNMKINDWKLSRINKVISKDYSINFSKKEEKFLIICDEYTKGNYINCNKLCKDQLEKQEFSLQCCEIYILSCIFGKIEFKNIFPNKCLANIILENMFKIMVKNSDIETSVAKLVKINYILGYNEYSLQIYGFLNKYFFEKENELIRNLSEINSYYLSPRFSEIYEDKEIKILFLDKLEKQSLKSTTIEFYYDMLNDNNLINDKYDKLRGKIYTADILIKNNLYNQAIEKYLEIIKFDLNKENKEKYDYLYEKILNKLYFCYIKSERIKEALELIVDNYIENVAYTCRLDKTLLLKLLKDDKNSLDNNISLPLFYYINEPKDKRNIYAAYDNYLLDKNIEKPSEIKKYLNEIDNKKLIMFLNNICTLDIMEDSFVFENDDDLESERILVCQILIEIDENNSKIYMNEIKHITEKMMIRKGIKKLDESKVFVDISKIKDYLKENMKYNIDRYIKISHMNKKYIEYDLMDLKNIYKDIEIIDISDGKMNLFKEIFGEVRDVFISSNEYGLDSYLSTRIRHGTLLGQLRKTFEIYNLITSKEDNKYINNEYWLDKLFFYDEKEKDKFNEVMREFSEKIDGKIIEVTNVWIKIKTSDKEMEEGRLFDYTISIEDYYKYYMQLYDVNDYEEFINRILEILLEITNRNLECVRREITETLNNNLLKELSDLENKLMKINYSNEKELIKNIAMCRTEIQNEITSISNWFYLNKNLDDNIYTFKELFDISKEILNSSYPNSKKIVFNMSINVSQKIKGNEYAYYIDILLILFSNILQRSNLKPEEIRVDIDAYQDENNIIIKVTNNHNNDKRELMNNIEEARNKIDNIDAYSDYNRQEGGTGFVKLEKTLKYNLRLNHNIKLDVNDDKFEVKISFKFNKENFI